MKKIAITGAKGRVGKFLVEHYDVVPLNADITHAQEIDDEIGHVNPDIIIHLAGISDVDFCQKKGNWEKVISVNYGGTGKVLASARQRKIKVVCISSDHIFSGGRFLGFDRGPYKESHLPTRHVVNDYGLSKLAMEALRLNYPDTMKIVRSSILFDKQRMMGKFMGKQGFIDAPTFIYRSYMYVGHFAEGLWKFANEFVLMPQILNISGSKTVSQFKFMCDYVGELPYTVRKRNYDVSGFAPRPHYCGLDTTLSAKLGFKQYSYLDGFEAMKND